PGESRDPSFSVSEADRWVPAFAGTWLIFGSDRARRGPQRRRGLRVDVDELLDAQAVAYLLDQLLGIEIDADRVFVVLAAVAHIILAFDRRREIVDQEFDLVV